MIMICTQEIESLKTDIYGYKGRLPATIFELTDTAHLIAWLKKLHYQYSYDLLDGRKSEGLDEKYVFPSVFSGFA